MKVYGLTGGIASGKSEVTRRFVELGVPVLDADRIAHEAIEPSGAAEQGVVEAFGESILTCGKIDREKLGARVFGDRGALDRLNSLVHPAVGQEFARRTTQLAEEGHEVVVYDAALLAENGKVPEGMEGLIVVVASHGERVRRMTENRGMTVEEAEKRIASQTPPEQKAALAKWVIENDGSLEALGRRVDEIAQEL